MLHGFGVSVRMLFAYRARGGATGRRRRGGWGARARAAPPVRFVAYTSPKTVLILARSPRASRPSRRRLVSLWPAVCTPRRAACAREVRIPCRGVRIRMASAAVAACTKKLPSMGASSLLVGDDGLPRCPAVTLPGFGLRSARNSYINPGGRYNPTTTHV